MKAKHQAILRQDEFGVWEMLFRIKPINTKPNYTNGLYSLVDIDKKMKLEVDCDGLKKRPRVIFKMYCKLAGKEKERWVRKAALARAMEGSPMLH